MSKKRLIDIDIAIGISIILVVYGHLLFNESLPIWYVKSRLIIYKFHMPLFMFFSGFLISYTYKPIKNWNEYRIFVIKKAKKFIPPYLFFSLFFIGFEFLSNNYSFKLLKHDILDTLLYPSKSPAGFLWYIFVLFQYYLILPLLKKIVSKSLIIALAISVLLQIFNSVEILNVNLFSFYLIFIVLGIIATEYLSIYMTIIVKYGFLLTLIFALVILINIYLDIPKIIMGILSIPSIHYISTVMLKTKLKNILIKVGRHSFYIYLMNTLVTGFLYLLLIKVFKLSFSFIILFLLFVCGVFLPIFIYKKIIKKTPLINKIIQ